MNIKTIFYTFLITILLITNLNAQFIGSYNLRDGGVDMPHSSLIVKSNNEFYIFYYGGYKTGKWIAIDKNNISLTETKNNSDAISIYGKVNKNSKGISINVYGLAKSNAFINFSKDTIATKEFQPVFNDWANCLSDNYKIKKKIGEFNWVTITCPIDPNFGNYGIKYPYKAQSYTFQLDKKFSEYVVVLNSDALNEKMSFNLTKKNDAYLINDASGFADNKELEREELTNEEFKNIENQIILIEKDNFKGKLGTLISSKSIQKINIYKPILKSIFTAKCDDEKVEIEENINNTKILVAADRTDGFYEVTNFKENEYDTKQYKLAKTASINNKDILSVNKNVSDYGGFEIELVFTEKGSLKLAELSKNNIRKPIAIVVNKLIVSTPIFASEITGGKANIGNGFSETEIDDLILSLKK